jgi:hypothetical protein
MTQRLAITVRVSAETLKKIDTEADLEFCSRAEAAAAKLESAYVDGAKAEKSEAATIRDRKAALELESLQIELARKRKETLTVDQVLEFVSKELGIIRSRLLAIPQTVMGLNANQSAELKKAVQDCMTDLSGDTRETWDDMAKGVE